MPKRKRKTSKTGWRRSKSGGVYKVKGKGKSRKKTYRTKSAAKKGR